MCSQALAERSRAKARAAGVQKSGGSVTHTTSGFQCHWASRAGTLLAAKLARCSSRFVPVTLRGTHSGVRSTWAPCHSCRV